MSLAPIKTRKKVSEIKTGVHLVVISDMLMLRNANKELLMIDGFPAIIVVFKDGQNNSHEQMYIMDGDFRQKYFQNMLRAAQVAILPGKTPKKSEAVGKRLWVGVQECHYINDDQPVTNPDGTDVIDYYVFKVYPITDSGIKPNVKGDPEKNNGIASDMFVTYKNVSNSFTKDEVELKPSKKNDVPFASKDDGPSFDDQDSHSGEGEVPDF